MADENDDSEHTTQSDTSDCNREVEWIDRHLGKIVMLVAVFCIVGLIGRAVTG